MKKSVYSLVLMDDVVQAIDALAYAQGTSRSNLINQILAERVSVITPKAQLEHLFDELSTHLRPYQQFQIQTQAADHMYSIKSALRYKYNPTIRYSFYIDSKNGHLGGELRIISRTQSEVLHHYLQEFFKVWAHIENEKCKAVWEQEEKTKWRRDLNLEAFETPELYRHLASHLSSYIQLLDQGLRIYFTEVEQGYFDPNQLRAHYEIYYKQVKRPI